MARPRKKQRRRSQSLAETLNERLRECKNQKVTRKRRISAVVAMFSQEVLKTFSGHVEIRQAAHDREMEWRPPQCCCSGGWESWEVTDVYCNKKVFEVTRGLTRKLVLVERCGVKLRQ